MNKEKIIWGAILLGAGTVLLLDNLGVVDFYWRSVIRMWPVIVIVIGLNLLLPATRTGKALALVVALAAVVFLGYVGTTSPRTSWREMMGLRTTVKERTGQDADGHQHYYRNVISRLHEDMIQHAELTIKGGAVSYEINEPTDDYLFWSEAESTIGAHTLETVRPSDSLAKLTFRMKDAKKKNWSLDSDKNEAKIRLNAQPVWKIKLEMGAGAADFDLREYKVSELELECGAAAVEAKLGMPVGHSEVRVESGAASIELEIPESAACRIVVKSALSSKDFKGFSKQDDGSYTTPGYQAEAADRYTIYLNGGISSFVVKRSN